MKKLKFLLLLFIFTSCAEKKDIFVKDVNFSIDNEEYSLTLTCYNFRDDEQQYMDNSFTSDNPDTLLSQITAKGKYNFRLCENFIIDSSAAWDIETVYRLMEDIKLPVTANLVCCEEEIDPEDFDIDNMSENPFYNLSVNGGKVDGVLSVADKKGNSQGVYLVHNSRITRYLPLNTWQVLNVITNGTRTLEYTFREGEYHARLEKINTSYAVKDDCLIVNIDMFLRSYKGIENNASNKQLFVNLLQADLKNHITYLFEDIGVNQIFNLKWYEKQRGKEAEQIQVNINIY